MGSVEPNLYMEAGRLEGMAMAIAGNAYDADLLRSELLSMAERLVPDRSQARGALEAARAVQPDR